MHTYADLEITLRKRDESSYAAGFRFNGPTDEAEQRFLQDEPITLNASGYLGAGGDPDGLTLGTALFTPPFQAAFDKAILAAEQQSAVLRVRLSIEPSAPELHAICWETLRDPRSPDAPLFMGERAVLSRFLSSAQDWRPIRLRPKAALRALVAIANPKDLETYHLTQVDVPGELDRARQALQNISLTELPSEGPASLDNIAAQLGKPPGFDILYLACHGALMKLPGDLQAEPRLWLEEDAPIKGADLVQRIRELDYRPRMVVLASCESAGKTGGALSAVGPRLSEAGVPAVVAMQGKVYMETIKQFMPRFFGELLEDGQIDRAMAVARGAVRARDDYWMPALFMRLRNGRIWYEPGFEGDKSQFEQWESICGFVRSGECVPILGPDVTENVFGSTRDLASGIAVNFPLDAHDQSDLAKVAQYLSTQHSPKHAQDKVQEAFIAQLQKNGERILGKSAAAMDAPALLEEIAAAGAKSENDPLRIVAGLNAKVFVNASNSGVLGLFLGQAEANGKKKEPVEMAIRWRDERRDDQKKLAAIEEPSAEKPLLYYVFGKMREPETWVLTEDDFFDYLIQTTRYNLMPPAVSEALVTGSLLFLGFPLDDWTFRVLFRLILAKGGSALLSRYNHVAVQVDPAETTFASARRAKNYMERYFRKSQIDIYWGTAADFLRDLNQQLKNAPVPAAAGGI